MTPLSALDLPLSGTRLIEASAGTGKTYTITTLLLRLLLERELRIDQILVVTFTNAATAELRQRVRQRLTRALAQIVCAGGGDPELDALLQRGLDPDRARRLLNRALCDLDEAAILTIHGFCQRALGEHAFESGMRFDLELLADDRSLIAEAVKDFWVTELHAASPAQLQYLKRQGVDLGCFEYLARIALGWPDVLVVPAAPPESAGGDLDQAIARYLELRTRAAAAWAECRDRVQELLLSPDLNRNIYRATRVAGWCQWLGELLAESEPILGERFDYLAKFTPSALRQATKARFSPPEHPFFELCAELALAGERARTALAEWLLGLQHALIERVPQQLARTKQTRGVLSFDDLLQGMDRALSGARGARFAARLASRYPAALIDEFQDTDAIQYRIFRAIYGERGALLLIGDPKQAIYAFRGADVFTYLRAARDATGTFTLELNWRSDPGLIHAQNTLFGRHPEAFLLPEISYRAVKPAPGATDRVRATPALAPLRFVFVEQAAQRGKRSRLSKTWAALNLPGLVAAEISALLADDVRLGEHRLEPGDIAVLTRTNRQALDVQQQLRQLGIPSVLHGDASVLESTEAQDLGYVLRALADPSRANAVRAALATPLLGLDAGALYALRQDEREWERWIERFRAWHLIWLERGFVQAFRSLLHEQDVLARLLGLVSGERITTNVLHLVELLHQAAREQHLGVSGLLQWFDQVRFDQSARDGMAPEAMQIRLESDDRAVQLTTMHKSKGLEYPVVVCPYLWDGVLLRRLERRYCRYHDPDTHGFVLDLTSDETARQSATREARAENLRLCYVALTRAKHLCVAFTGAFKHYEQSSLAHLVHGASPDRRLSDADDALLLADYAELARESGGAIALARAGERAARAYRPENASAPELAARRPSRRVHAAYRNSSFSALTSVEGLITGRDSSERDRDVAAPGELLGDEVQGSSSVVLAEFPRGPTAGDALHWILERLDFGDPSETAVASIVRQGLARRAIDVERWTGAVTQALCDVLATPLALGKPELRLQAVGLAQRKNELEFLFPVTPLASGGLVSPAELARVFRQHGESELERYVPELERLAFTPFTGFLRGFIDLVFFHAGRWYVVDYKSNHLGAEPADYAALRLAGAMREHHYYLQYHLYVLALHRYLAQRIADYDYERDFGGVYYLFLRGMHPRHGARYGVFHDRPPLELVRALSDVFGGAGGRAA